MTLLYYKLNLAKVFYFSSVYNTLDGIFNIKYFKKNYIIFLEKYTIHFIKWIVYYFYALFFCSNLVLSIIKNLYNHEKKTNQEFKSKQEINF